MMWLSLFKRLVGSMWLPLLAVILVGIIVVLSKKKSSIPVKEYIQDSLIIRNKSIKSSLEKVKQNEVDRKIRIDSVALIPDSDLQRAIDSEFNYPNR